MPRFTEVVPIDPDISLQGSIVHRNGSTGDFAWWQSSMSTIPILGCFYYLSILNSFGSAVVGLVVYQSSLDQNSASAVSLSCLILAGVRLFVSISLPLKGQELMMTSHRARTNAETDRLNEYSRLGVVFLLILYFMWLVLIFWEHTLRQLQLTQPTTKGQPNRQVWPEAAYWLIYLIILCGVLEATVLMVMWWDTDRLMHGKKEVVLKHIQYTPPEISNNPNMQNNSEATSSCAVCLEDFEPEETIAELACGHIFHSDCIRAWLVRREDCPFRCC